ncbi:hypothetical protein HXX76_013642 [Chlamydomonas incerta]|uniref:LysM domain-containing protein n=1 Tax=Chlamydomonas incerta TaxID=51695 RepID=A0A835SH36_CHLIN|nr:hypothetical protein HXX76_013642 [Chlamydomonas incerta]|eukprot:KAG2425431.1 hypothetical protein HXX76_013642 [Chlamydomonas incerta]
MGWDGYRRGRGISNLAFRCSAALNSNNTIRPDTDGRFWVQLGASPLVVVDGSMFAATEVFMNSANVLHCGNHTIISRLEFDYTLSQEGAMIWRVRAFCGLLPPPPKDSSWFDIAARYGVTLSDLMRSNPEIVPTSPLSAYNDTSIRVPQLCGATSTQPPVSTISANCNKWWPLPNTSFAGTWTCGDIAGAHLGRNLQYLNSINLGVCPMASTRVPRGMRLCIAPPSSVRSAAAAVGHRRRTMRQFHQSSHGAEGRHGSLTAVYPAGLRQRLGGGRALLQTPGGGTCILTSWVAVGQTCDDITTSYNIDLGVFLNYNPGLDCAAMDVGTEVRPPPLRPAHLLPRHL